MSDSNLGSREAPPAKKLGLLADCVVHLKPAFVTRSLLDEIVVALRLGEKTIIDLQDDVRRLRVAAPGSGDNSWRRKA